MNSKVWLSIFFLLTLIFIYFLSIFNLRVDPYGYFDTNNKYVYNLSHQEKPKILENKLFQDVPLYLIGTSRFHYINPNDIVNMANKRVLNINISGSTLVENLSLLQTIKDKKANFIYSFDAFSLNSSRLESYEIKNRVDTYLDIFENYSNKSFIEQYFQIATNYDIFKQSINYYYYKLLNRDFEYSFNLFNNENSNFTLDSIDDFAGIKTQNEPKLFSNYTIFDKKLIINLANSASNEDIFVIFPKHYYYYKLFQNNQDIEKKYFEAIKLLVDNTDAKVISFYGINKFTINKSEFDADGWHFKPRVGKIIVNQIYNYDSSLDFGYILTRENIDKVLLDISKDIRDFKLK